MSDTLVVRLEHTIDDKPQHLEFKLYLMENMDHKQYIKHVIDIVENGRATFYIESEKREEIIPDVD
jgi:hypothetical protein